MLGYLPPYILGKGIFHSETKQNFLGGSLCPFYPELTTPLQNAGLMMQCFDYKEGSLGILVKVFWLWKSR